MIVNSAEVVKSLRLFSQPLKTCTSLDCISISALTFSANPMYMALHLGMKRLKDCCPYLRVLDVKFGGSKQELINPNLVHTCLTYFNRLDKICFSRGSLNIAVPLCSQPYPFNTIKKLEFDTMKFDKEHLQEIVQIFPVLQELTIANTDLGESDLISGIYRLDRRKGPKSS